MFSTKALNLITDNYPRKQENQGEPFVVGETNKTNGGWKVEKVNGQQKAGIQNDLAERSSVSTSWSVELAADSPGWNIGTRCDIAKPSPVTWKHTLRLRLYFTEKRVTCRTWWKQLVDKIFHPTRREKQTKSNMYPVQRTSHHRWWRLDPTGLDWRAFSSEESRSKFRSHSYFMHITIARRAIWIEYCK